MDITFASSQLTAVCPPLKTGYSAPILPVSVLYIELHNLLHVLCGFTTDSENRHLHIILSSLYLINIVTPGPRGRLNAHQTPNMSSSVIIVAIAYGIQPAKPFPYPVFYSCLYYTYREVLRSVPHQKRSVRSHW